MITFLLITIGFGTLASINNTLQSGIESGAGFGFVFGLFAVFAYSGIDLVQHFVLRLLLVAWGHTPDNLASFLDYAVERIFLVRVGGGYRFIHEVLRTYFAAIGMESQSAK